MAEPKIFCSYTKLVAPDDLKPNPANPNRHPDSQVDLLAKLIMSHGWRHPVTVSKRSGCIVSGHCRLLAAQKLGLEHIPIDEQDFASEAEEMAVLVADNKIPELSETDGLMMADILCELDQVNYPLELTALTPEEIEDYVVGPTKPNPQDDVIPEPPKKAKTKTGDLYILGDHRLLCGDSTKSEDVERLMNGQKAGLCFTSPPYSDQRIYGGGKDLTIEHLAEFIPISLSYVGIYCVNLGIKRKDQEVIEYWQEYIRSARKSGLKLLSWNVWDKKNATSVAMQTAMFAIQHEWILVFGDEPIELERTIEKSPESHKREAYYRTDKKGRMITTRRQADGTVKESTIGLIYAKKQLGTVVSAYAEMSRSIRCHPAMFPVELPLIYIEAFASDVYDPFLGSGTTLIACEKLNRRCFGIEIDPIYVDVIVNRWQDFTGRKVELIKDKLAKVG